MPTSSYPEERIPKETLDEVRRQRVEGLKEKLGRDLWWAVAKATAPTNGMEVMMNRAVGLDVDLPKIVAGILRDIADKLESGKLSFSGGDRGK